MIPILLALLACDDAAELPPGGKAAALVYSGNVDGDIEPCG